MVPPEPFLHGEESCFLQIPHTPTHGTFRHLQFPGHGGDGWPADPLFVSPAPQVEIHSDSPVGKVALVKPLRSVIFPLLSSFLLHAAIGLWRSLYVLDPQPGIFAAVPVSFLILLGFRGRCGTRFLARGALLAFVLHFCNHRRRRVFLQNGLNQRLFPA